jgi:hypothetical protein
MGKMYRDVQECVVTCWERLVLSPERHTMMIQKPLSLEQAVKEVAKELTLKQALQFLKENNHLD